MQQIKAVSSTVSLSSSLNPSSYGKNVILTATVGSSASVPTGTITFLDSSMQLGTMPLKAGVAVLSVGTLGAGTHQLTANYSGDGSHAEAVSSPLPLTVNKASTITRLSSAPNPSPLSQPVTITATVSSGSGGSPGGMVTLLDGASVLGTPSLNGGVAALKVSALASGAHNITASYGGNSNFASSLSPVLVQAVVGLGDADCNSDRKTEYGRRRRHYYIHSDSQLSRGARSNRQYHAQRRDKRNQDLWRRDSHKRRWHHKEFNIRAWEVQPGGHVWRRRRSPL